MAGIPGLGFLGKLPGLGWTRKIPGNPLGVGPSAPAPVTAAATVGGAEPPKAPITNPGGMVAAADRARKRTRAGMTIAHEPPRLGPKANVRPPALIGY